MEESSESKQMARWETTDRRRYCQTQELDFCIEIESKQEDGSASAIEPTLGDPRVGQDCDQGYK